MGILPCKLSCPLLPYMETVGSSVGSPLLPNMKKWAAEWAAHGAHGNFAMQIKLPTNSAHGLQVGNGVGCPWAAHGNFAMQIGLPTTSIYGNSGHLSGQPTTSKYEKVGSSMGSGVGCPWEFSHAN